MNFNHGFVYHFLYLVLESLLLPLFSTIFCSLIGQLNKILASDWLMVSHSLNLNSLFLICFLNWSNYRNGARAGVIITIRNISLLVLL